MRIKTVSVNYGRKLNMGDYNSATVECTLWADMDEGDDEAVCMSGLWDMAKANVKAQLQPLVAKQSAEVQTIFLGLPAELRKVVDYADGHGGLHGDLDIHLEDD